MHLRGELKYSSSDFCDCERFFKICKESVHNLIIQIYSEKCDDLLFCQVFTQHIIKRAHEQFHHTSMDLNNPQHFCSIFLTCTHCVCCKLQWCIMKCDEYLMCSVNTLQRELLKILYFCFCSYVKHIYNKNHETKDMLSVFLLFVLRLSWLRQSLSDILEFSLQFGL